MCANELAEVRKLTKLLSQTQIAIERIILRLETVKELSTIMIGLKPALNSLKGVTTSLVNVMPDIASVLENVNDSIVETLTVTKVTSDPSIIRTDLKTPGGQEILQEVHAVLEERLTESLPQPPISEPLPTLEADQPVRKMVALPVGCPESPRKDSAERAANPEAFFSVEDIELQSMSVTFPESVSMEDRILEYIKERKGQINITDCALKLKIPPNEVEKTLENLGAKGKIVLKT